MLESLEASFGARSSDDSLFRAAWSGVAELMPPAPFLPCDALEMPSFLLARHAGDLGFAILWIVQSTLVRSLLADLGPGVASMSGGGPATIGALAHSEDSAHPVTAVERGDVVELSGVKKYITGGIHADFVMVTARKPGDDKISSITAVPAASFPTGALRPLAMDSLKTTSHASLRLDAFTAPRSFLISAEPAALRKAIKRWSIIERSLIMQAYAGLVLYAAEKLAQRELAGTIMPALDDHNRLIAAQLASARAGDRVPEDNSVLSPLLASANPLISALHADAAPSSRLPDLLLFRSMKL